MVAIAFGSAIRILCGAAIAEAFIEITEKTEEEKAQNRSLSRLLLFVLQKLDKVEYFACLQFRHCFDKLVDSLCCTHGE